MLGMTSPAFGIRWEDLRVGPVLGPRTAGGIELRDKSSDGRWDGSDIGTPCDANARVLCGCEMALAGVGNGRESVAAVDSESGPGA